MMTTSAPSTRNPIWNVLIPLAAILLFVVGGLLLVKSQLKDKAEVSHPAGGDQKDAVELKVGATLPDFPLQQFGSDKFIQASELKFKVTLINFWATWCDACMVEMPSILKLREAYKDKGFEVIAINVDQNPEAVLPKVIQRMGFDFPVYMDKSSKLSDLFQIQAIPLSLVIDHHFKILMIENGERDWNGEDVHADLNKWLAAQ